MIKRKTSTLPQNYFLSVAKMIADQWEIMTAEIDYQTDIWHLMETTRLVGTYKLAHEPEKWPIWYQMDYVFGSRSTASPTGSVTTTASMNKLMLFSPDRQVYVDYMGNLANDEMEKYLPEFDYSTGVKHEIYMMAKYLVPFHCELENENCLRLARVNFNAVKNGEKTWADLNVNHRSFSLRYGIRLGDESDVKFIEDEIFANVDDQSFFREGVSALRWSKSIMDVIKVLDRIRTETPQHFSFTVNELTKQFWLRDETVVLLANEMASIYPEYKDNGLASWIESACTYINTASDEQLIDQLKNAVNQAANDEIPKHLQFQFEKCDSRLAINRQWHANVGAKIVLWLRYFAK